MLGSEKVSESESVRGLLQGLNDKQKLFCFEYLKCHCNATRAAIAAGYSKKAPRVAAHQLLTNTNIRTAISALLELEGYAPEFCKCKLGAYARANIVDFEPWLTGEKSLEDLQNEGVDTSLIESATISPTKYGENRNLTLYDAQRAVETLVKMHGLFGHRGDPLAAPENREALEVTRCIVIDDYSQHAGEPVDLGIPGLEPLERRMTGGLDSGDDGGDGDV